MIMTIYKQGAVRIEGKDPISETKFARWFAHLELEERDPVIDKITEVIPFSRNYSILWRILIMLFLLITGFLLGFTDIINPPFVR